VRFHEAIADAAGNAFLNLIGKVINEVIVDLVADTIRTAADADRVRKDFLDLHHQIFDAIKRQDGEEAARLARTSLYDVYGSHVSESERAKLKLLI
jgi:DNA-binding FadR family transcriptional regulator